MAEETKGKTPEEEKPAEKAKPKAPSRPPAVALNTSFRFALQRNEQRLDESSDLNKIKEETQQAPKEEAKQAPQEEPKEDK